MAERIDLPVDVGVPGATIAARVIAPVEPERLPDPLWVWCHPGATGNWRYFDFDVPGRPDEDYSFARFLAARGIGVVAIDTLGTGDSRFPADGSLLTLETLAAANHQAATAMRERLPEGTLLCGLGHSGGGGVSIVTQGEFATFDLLAVLGMPADDVEIHGGHDAVRAEFAIDEQGLLYREQAAPGQRARGFLDDVPLDVIEAREVLPFPPSYPSVMRNGTLLPYARKIACPVFVGMGEVDYVGSPFDEPSRYAQSKDVTVYVQPGSAHWHNLSTTRRELWATFANWLWGRARFRDGRRPDTAPRA